MGTGLGPESYAIIEQGRIGQILSSRPQDRRNVIEEAAGISKFKNAPAAGRGETRGRAAEPFPRLFDILEEVGRQCNSLKRQANKARNAIKTAPRRDDCRAAANARRPLPRCWSAKRPRLPSISILPTPSFQNLTTQVSEKEKQQAATQEQAYQTEAELTETRGKLAELRVDGERTRGPARVPGKADCRHRAERLTHGETETQSLDGPAESRWASR